MAEKKLPRHKSRASDPVSYSPFKNMYGATPFSTADYTKIIKHLYQRSFHPKTIIGNRPVKIEIDAYKYKNMKYNPLHPPKEATILKKS